MRAGCSCLKEESRSLLAGDCGFFHAVNQRVHMLIMIASHRAVRLCPGSLYLRCCSEKRPEQHAESKRQQGADDG